MKMHTLTKIATISRQFKKCHTGRFTPPFFVYNNSMKFNVTDVEFDFDDMYSNDDFTCLSFDEEIELRDLALGVWEAEDEDDLIEEVTTACGWCIKSIDYDIQLK